MRRWVALVGLLGCGSDVGSFELAAELRDGLSRPAGTITGKGTFAFRCPGCK